MFWGEWYQIVVGVVFFVDFCVYICIVGVDGNVIKCWCQCIQIVMCLCFQFGMVCFVMCSDGVVGLVGVVLIVKVNQEQFYFCCQCVVVVVGIEFLGLCFFWFNIVVLYSFVNLVVLYGVE